MGGKIDQQYRVFDFNPDQSDEPDNRHDTQRIAGDEQGEYASECSKRNNACNHNRLAEPPKLGYENRKNQHDRRDDQRSEITKCFTNGFRFASD